MNTSRPPYCVDPRQNAEDAAIEIVECFRALENVPGKVRRVFATLAENLGFTAGAPVIAAGGQIAEAIDNLGQDFELPYHNKQHACEVMLCSHFLASLLKVERQHHIEIIIAALFHDFYHDGINLDIPFRLERNSIVRADPYLSAFGVPTVTRQKLAALVLATHPKLGLPTALAYFNSHLSQTSIFPTPPVGAPELLELHTPSNAILALILCLADVLPSLGLTTEYAMVLQERLAQEWQTDLGEEDKLRFINGAKPLFGICDFFLPNVFRLRAHLLKCLELRLNANTSS